VGFGLKSLFLKFGKDVFMLFSFGSTVCFILLDVLPHPIRNLFFKLRLGKLGKGVLIDYKVYMRYLNNIEIGNGVAINRGCEFYTSMGLGKKIVLGENVVISPNSKFYGAAHDHRKPEMPDIAGDIIIGDGCWICADCTLLPGVEVGRGSVVAAGSVVVNDIPEYSVAAGNPAKVVRKREMHEVNA